jgi:hypothetical protein
MPPHIFIFIISKYIGEIWFVKFIINAQTQLHFQAHEMETKLFSLPQNPISTSMSLQKRNHLFLQKVYQRTNYDIKWGGVQNSLNDK